MFIRLLLLRALAPRLYRIVLWGFLVFVAVLCLFATASILEGS